MKKKILSVIILISLVLVNTGYAKRIYARGGLETKEVRVRSFVKLDVRTQIDVYLSQGNEEKLVIETYESIMPHVNVDQKGKTLNVYLDRNINRILWQNRSHMLKVFITVKDIEEIKLSGNCDLIMQTELSVKDLKIDASGASDLSLKKISGENIKIDASGASDIKNAEFEAASLYINASGASDANVWARAKKVTIISSGASDFDLVTEGETCALRSSGASDFDVSGTCNYLRVNFSGASDLEAMALKSRDVKVDASGSSHVRVYASEKLDANCSGMSTIHYTGNPGTLSTNVSGLSSIKSK
ncbi:MAG: head GIN domain-containing protein [Candidatus Marinimicrobia bacterium]|nr:head GIN domain-containing protein [Candidatus Neomarinimicrobiota bacterium]